MREAEYDAEIDRLRSSRNRWRRNAAVLMYVSLASFTLMLFSVNRVRTIVVPPVLSKTFWLQNNAVSPSYIAQMAPYFVTLALNVTPKTADAQAQEILRYVSPQTYRDLQPKLEAAADKIKQLNVSSTFFKKRVIVPPGRMEAAVLGTKVTFVGQQVVGSKSIAYLVRFAYQGGKMVVTEFHEVNSNDPFKANASAPDTAG